MPRKDPSAWTLRWAQRRDKNARADAHAFEQSRSPWIQSLLAAGARAAHLGISLLDSETRFQFVNAALARETRTSEDQHIGKSSREIVGDLATQIEPTYEKVLRTGKPASVSLSGRVRETPESGYWFDYCFPVCDRSHQVQQLGLFVVNVTAEKASGDILYLLATDTKFQRHQPFRLLADLDESVRRYHSRLTTSLIELACPATEAARKADGFRSAIDQLDEEIQLMREMIYTILARYPIPAC
jgi:hypothetical protein